MESIATCPPAVLARSISPVAARTLAVFLLAIELIGCRQSLVSPLQSPQVTTDLQTALLARRSHEVSIRLAAMLTTIPEVQTSNGLVREADGWRTWKGANRWKQEDSSLDRMTRSKQSRIFDDGKSVRPAEAILRRRCSERLKTAPFPFAVLAVQSYVPFYDQ